MATRSVYPQVATRLYELMVTNLLGEDVGVYRGAPLQETRKDNVFIGNIEKGHQDYPVARPGRKPRNEEFQIIVMLVSQRLGERTCEATENRVLELMGELEDVIAADPSLGITPTLVASVDEYEMDTFVQDPGGWRSVMIVRVLVKARLT